MAYPSKATITARDVLTLAKCACNAVLEFAAFAAFLAVMIFALTLA